MWEYVTTDIGVYLALMPCCFNRVTNAVIRCDSAKAAHTNSLFLLFFLKQTSVALSDMGSMDSKKLDRYPDYA